MQQELILAPVRAKYVNKQMLHPIGLEDVCASSGRRRDGKSAVWHTGAKARGIL
jgi:hypothetical protein